MNDQTCNGWTNYPTWRVSLEFFADTDEEELIEIFGNNPKDIPMLDVEGYLEDIVLEHINNDAKEGSIAHSYAYAFTANVNWYEIAEHLYQRYQETLDTEGV
jgi:hypothetical protein